jgi:hypothetical protein
LSLLGAHVVDFLLPKKPAKSLIHGQARNVGYALATGTEAIKSKSQQVNMMSCSTSESRR